jgi:L-asparaginase
MTPKPRIHLIATGGTIAGTAPDAADTQHYTIGGLSAEALVAGVPPLKNLAEISVEQLCNLDSKDMTPAHWLGLARATQAALARPEVDGVVVTHGTDTMEESAFFLDLVLPPGKPVVFTGAMRPATALSADGPMNLFDAVTVAASAEARDLGVVLVMHGRIHAARNVTKGQPLAQEAFTSGEAGVLGWVPPVRISRRPIRVGAPTGIPATDELPRVDLLLVGAGSSPDLIAACINAGARGVVLALPGNASLPVAWEAAALPALAAGAAVLRCARAGSGASRTPLPGAPQIPTSSLPAAKARVALMVALAASGRPELSALY